MGRGGGGITCPLSLTSCFTDSEQDSFLPPCSLHYRSLLNCLSALGLPEGRPRRPARKEIPASWTGPASHGSTQSQREPMLLIRTHPHCPSVSFGNGNAGLLSLLLSPLCSCSSPLGLLLNCCWLGQIWGYCFWVRLLRLGEPFYNCLCK